jgi:Restriction endonuclease
MIHLVFPEGPACMPRRATLPERRLELRWQFRHRCHEHYEFSADAFSLCGAERGILEEQPRPDLRMDQSWFRFQLSFFTSPRRLPEIRLDHAKLQAFRDEFDVVYSLTNPHERGNRFEKLMNDIFSYYNERSEGPFSRTGEQVDGLIYFDKHWYLVEIRWKADKSNAADVSVLRDRASRAFGGDTKALFISFNGFSQDCLDSMLGGDHERVILFDGGDLRCVLDCQIPFDLLLAEKQLELVKNKRPNVSAFEIIARRR